MPHTPIRILLVENDPDDQEAFRRMVAAYGLPYQYQTARSVDEARQLIARHPLDVIILDHRAPDGSAFDLLDAVDAVPCIVTTPRGCEDVAVQAMERGAAGYLIKDDDRNYLTLLPLAITRACRQKETEKALQTSERRYRTLVEHAPEAIVVFDVESGLFVDSNANAEALYGLAREQLHQTGPAAMSPEYQPDGRRSSEAALEEIMGAVQGEVRVFEWVHKNARGDEIPCEVRLVRMPSADRVLVRGSVTDITKRKHALEALQASEELNRRMVEAIPGGIVRVSAQGAILHANDEAQRILGLSYDVLTQSYVADFEPRTIWEDGSPCPVEDYPVSRCLQTGQAQPPVTIGVHRPDGTTTWAIYTAVPLLDLETHEASGAVVTFLDITDRKHAEAEQARLIKELEARNAELERFTYTVSHDLKTPLVTIKGFLGLLLRDLRAGNEKALERAVEHISNAADRMARLLDELLELSRIGRVINPSEEFSLTELAHEALKLVVEQTTVRGIVVEIASGMPVVFADRVRLLEVFQNLIDNAAKFMGDEPDPRIEIGSRTDGEEVICYVKDNGVGIAPEYHEQIFGLFDRLDAAVEGTGIGLALVKRIVEVHGGRIWVESEGEGHGSTFFFTLPRRFFSRL